jgi:RHS repeat-associated protein
MKIALVRASRLPALRRLALVALVLLVACGRPGGAIEDVGTRAQAMSIPGTPPPPATLGWPSPAVVGSEPTGTLAGEGSVGVAGDYRYTLPIEVPPGRAGMAPSLSLSYSSSGENGIAGVGWALTGLSSIKPCNMTVATDGAAEEGPNSAKPSAAGEYSVQKVAWCLDGQRLVSSGEDDPYGAGVTHVFRTEADSFARIESTQAVTNNPALRVDEWTAVSFKVFLKDGRIRSYAQDPNLLNEFLLAVEEDRFGNSITYSYTPPETTTARMEQNNPAPLPIAEETARLATITYTGRVSSGELGLRKVWLKYENRPDAIFMTDSTPVTSSKKRLQSIDCYAPAPGVGTSIGVPVLAWSYALTYTLSEASGRSLLASVKRTGTQGSAQYAKQFDWLTTKGGVYAQPNYALPQRDTAGDYVVLDVDHDGRDELLYSPPGPFSPHFLYSTAGAGQPLLQVTSLPGLSNATLTDATVGDIDGDGVPEIIAPDRTANIVGTKAYQVYKWSSATKDYVLATSINKPWLNYLDLSSNSVEQPIFLVDMDGDGLPDMIQAQYANFGYNDPSCVAATTPERPKCLYDYHWYYFHNNGGTFGPVQPIWGYDLPPRSGSPFSASVLADRAGRSYFSGMTDLWAGPKAVKLAPDDSVPSLIDDSKFFPKCIHGNFTGRGNEPVCDDLPFPWRSTVFDFDGDGRDELFEYTGQSINGTFAVLANQRIHFDDAGARHVDWDPQTPLMTGDFNGDGLQDAILYDHALGKTFAALNMGPTRDLVVGVRNETAFKPMESVQYSQRWSAEPVTAKPCNVHPEHCLRQGMNVVVERDVYQGSDVDSYEHSFFNYEDPRMDVHGRGFLGFATVRAWNPDRLSETITEYDNATSVNGVYFAFMPSRVSQYTAIAPVADAHGTFSVRGSVVSSKYAVDHPTKLSYFQHPTTWDSVEWETNATIDMTVGVAKHFVFAGPVPTPLRQRNGETSFDDYGNQTYSRSETVGGAKTEITSTYDIFLKSWLIGEITQTLATVTEPGDATPQPRQVDYSYGAKGELASVKYEGGYTNPDPEIGYTVTFGYNDDGLSIRTTGWAAKEGLRNIFTEYDPDEGIFPRKVWNDLGQVTQMLYHPVFSEISDEITANGVESQIVIDGLGRTRKVSHSGENPVFIKPGPRTNAGGKLIGSYVDTNGAGVATTHTEYDEYGRALLQQHIGFDGTAIFSRTKYDGLGRLQFSSRSGFGLPAVTGTTYSYDGLNRVVSVVPPDGLPTTAQYTFFKTRTFDQNNHENDTVRDVNGRLAQRLGFGDNGVVASVTFQYGNFNQIKAITDSKNNASRFYYDQRGRRVSLSDPDAGVSTYHYNGFGDVTELDVPGINGSAVPAQTFYKRDALGRVVHVKDGDGATDFTWDTSPFGIGLLASQSSPSVAQTFEYDWYGRPSRETWTVDQESFDMLTSYDGSGRVSTVSYPDVPGRKSRFTVQRNYSSTQYLASVEEIDLPSSVKFWDVLARNADDQLLQGQFGNGRLSKRVYEPTMGRLKSITDMGCVGVNCVGADYSLGYTYLNDGNVDSRTDYVTGRAERFGYDALDRLTEWDLTYGGGTINTGYKYDEIGNLTDVLVGTVPTESNTPYSGGVCSAGPGSPCPGPHALKSATVGGLTQKFGYDTRGRQVNAPGREVTFTEANLPKTIDTKAGSTVFSYDAAGSRVKKVGPSEETLTLGGLYERRVTKAGIQHVFFVSGGDGNMTQVSFTEGSPNSDRVEYLHTDALGSTGAVTDDAGSVTRSYHDPFGARIDEKGAPFSGQLGDVRLGFTGHVSDDDLALVNMKGRIYDPAQRRFLSPDPLVSAPANAQSYNRYSYVWNNPLNFTDPTGFEGQPPPPPPPPPGGGTDDHTGGPGKDLKDGGPQGGGGPGGNVSGGSPATVYKASHAQGQSAGAASVPAGNKWNPFSTKGRIEQAVFGSTPDPVPYFPTPTPLEAAIAKAGIGLVPGLNSSNVLSDPESTTFDKAFAVTTDVLSVVGVGTVLRAGATGAGIVKSLVVGAEVVEAVVVAEGVEQAVVVAAKAEQVVVKGGVYALVDGEGTIVRTGRTNDFVRRAAEHFRSPATTEFTFKVLYETDEKAAQRGVEQYVHNLHSPLLNKIQPISPLNPRGPAYMKAALKVLGLE